VSLASWLPTTVVAAGGWLYVGYKDWAEKWRSPHMALSLAKVDEKWNGVIELNIANRRLVPLFIGATGIVVENGQDMELAFPVYGESQGSHHRRMLSGYEKAAVIEGGSSSRATVSLKAEETTALAAMMQPVVCTPFFVDNLARKRHGDRYLFDLETDSLAKRGLLMRLRFKSMKQRVPLLAPPPEPEQ
jgi:hypothetical protein